MPGMPLTLTEVSLWHLIPQTHIYQPLQHPEHYLLFPSMATTQYLFSHLPISKHWLCACPVPCIVQVTRKKKRNKVQFLSSKHSLSRSPTTKILSVTKINKWINKQRKSSLYINPDITCYLRRHWVKLENGLYFLFRWHSVSYSHDNIDWQ